jgi:serine phosphatase RsbU (regulator of sigma subunit)
MLAKIDTYLEEKQIELALGDKILLYTDGVTEAENQSGDRFGLERLQESFLKHSRKGSADLMSAIKEDVYAFIGVHPQYDDITLVVLEAKVTE